MKIKPYRALIVIAASTSLLFSAFHPIDPGQETAALSTPVEAKILENGLMLICQQDTSSAITVVQILIKGGYRDER